MKSGMSESDMLNSDIDVLLFVLEKLYGASREDLAFRLLDRFGSVHGIFSASYDELLTINGITKRVATFFSTVRPAGRQALLRERRDSVVQSEADAVAFAATYFVHQPSPADAIAYLTDDDKIAAVDELHANFDTRDVIVGLCRHNAKKFLWIRKLARILQYPTRYELTRLDRMIKILQTAELMNMQLVDYVTIVNGRFLGIRGSYALRRAADASVAAYPKTQNIIERFEKARELLIASGDGRLE